MSSLYETGTGFTTGDETPPTAPIVSGTTPTNDRTPTWNWSSGGGGNGTYRYELDDSDLTSGATQTTDTSYTPGSNISTGTRVLYVQERDAAGNWSSSGSRAIVIDTTAPSAPSIALSSDTGSSNSDGITNNRTVNITGLETNATWQYSVNSGSNWTNGSDTSFTLSEGNYDGTVRARQTDQAGNTSSVGSLGSITVDTTAPTVSSVAITSSTSNTDTSNYAIPSVCIGGECYIYVTATFNENVTKTGSPQLTIIIGQSGSFGDRTATFEDGSGTTALVFKYAIQSGDAASNYDNDGLSIGADALDLNSATIKDAAGNDATITHNAVAANPLYKVK